MVEPGDDGAAQIRLRQTRHCGVHRRQRGGQGPTRRLEMRVHHGQPHETAPHLAPGADAVAHRQRLLVRRVKTEKAHHTGVRAIIHRHQQLTARAHRDLAGGDRGLDLHRVALAGIGQLDDACLVLVAQRQVQRQVDVTHQPQLAQGFLRGSQGFGGGRGALGHAPIVPRGQSLRRAFWRWRQSTAR